MCFCSDQRRQEADDVALHSALDHQQSGLAGALDDLLSEGGVRAPAVRADHLHRQHEAAAADLADTRMAALQVEQTAAQLFAQGDPSGDQVLLFKDVQDCQGCGAGQGVAAVGTAQATGQGCVHDGGATDHPGERQAAGQALGYRHQVGLDAGLLEGEEAAGTAEAGLDLVSDEDDTVLVAQRAQPLEEFHRCRTEAAVALYRFDQDGGHLVRGDLGGEHFAQAGQGLLGVHAVEGIRVGRVIDVAGEGAEVLLVGLGEAGQGYAQQRAAMEAAAEGDHPRPLGMGTGDLDGVLHRFGPGGQQQRLVGLPIADQGVEAAGQFQVGLVGHHLETGVGDLPDLAADGLHHPRVIVADVEHADAADEIEVAATIHVPDFAALGAGHHDGVGGDDAAGNALFAITQQTFGGFGSGIHAAILQAGARVPAYAGRGVGNAEVAGPRIAIGCFDQG